MKLSIAGYKSIAEQRTVEIGGLTILAGANSSGKSSFMQPLVLIKQTLENDFDAGALLLDGFNVKLSDSSQIRSKVPLNGQDCFSVGLVDKNGPVSGRYLVTLATQLIHVPGVRGNPERSYKTAATGASSFPGSFEKYVASIINHWQADEAQHEKIAQLQSQLKLLGLASMIAAEKLNDTRLEIRISRHNGYSPVASDLVNIADVGFGVSQILPVLVALLVAKKDQLVYIEEPELHLHPRAQFALAKVIASAVSERQVKVVIETHSSILIRGVQILVVKGELNPELVSLNWFTQDPQSGQTDITEAKLDKLGAFGDWPEDFDAVTLDVEKQYLDAVEQALENEI